MSRARAIAHALFPVLLSFGVGCSGGGGGGESGPTAPVVPVGPSAQTAVTGTSFTSTQTGQVSVTTDVSTFFAATSLLADFDQNGFADLAIGLPGATVRTASTSQPVRSGSVFVFFGKTDGSLESDPTVVIPKLPLDNMSFGQSLAASGSRLLVGAPGTGGALGQALNGVHTALASLTSSTAPSPAAAPPGSVHLVSLAGAQAGDTVSSSLVLELTGGQSSDLFGFDVAFADVDGDQRLELVAGAPGVAVKRGAAPALPGAGAIWTFFLNSSSTATVATVSTTEAVPEIGALFGFCVASGDVNGDGRDELVVAAPLGSTVGSLGDLAGEVKVFTLPTSTAKTTLVDVVSGGFTLGLFGESLDVADLDEDGRADLVVGAPFATMSLVQDEGAFGDLARALSGRLQADLLADLAGSIAGGGEVFVYRSGPSRLEAPTFLSPLAGSAALDAFGWRVQITDLDVTDGRKDIVVSAPFRRSGSQLTSLFNMGVVFVFQADNDTYNPLQLVSESTPGALRPFFGLALSARGSRIAVGTPVTIRGALLTGLGGLAPGDTLLFTVSK